MGAEIWRYGRRGGVEARMLAYGHGGREVWTHVGVKARRNLRGLISMSDWEMRSPRFEK